MNAAHATIPVMSRYYLYIIASGPHRELSIGVAARLGPAVRAHRRRMAMTDGQHAIHRLVYAEALRTAEEAVQRELELARLGRRELERVVESVNPAFEDISLRRLLESGFDG